MLFNSVAYIFGFLPFVILVYFLLNGRHLVAAAKWWLVAASLVFYAVWNVRNLPVLLGSVAVNWLVVRAIWRSLEASRPAGAKLAFGVAFNLLYLGAFKYYDAIAAGVNQGLGWALPLLHVALPLGISFFTLTQIAYLVDAKEGLVSRQRFGNFALFVVFFPHLIIGPILHHKQMMPQFEALRTKVFSLENLSAGVLLFAIGFAKKALLADPLSPYVAFHFDSMRPLGALEAWQAAVAFTCQLYFDFSGYTDMALGSALMLNIRMPENFDSPLRSRSVIEFWSRWHMTLTNFLTTYIYTPVLMSFRRVTLTKSLLAVFITFFVSGIWHGAGFTFLAFGAAHGAALAVNHAWRRARLPMPAFAGWLLTFVFVCCTLVLFRSKGMDEATRVFAGMAGMNGATAGGWPSPGTSWDHLGAVLRTALDAKVVALVAVSAVVVFGFPNSGEIARRFRKSLGGARGVE